MNRTIVVCALALCATVSVLTAQEKQPPADAKAEDPLVKELVAKLQDAEGKAKSVYQELRTKGTFPGGLKFETTGVLRVLRGEHPRLQARVEFSFEDGFSGRMETLKTEEGVWILEHSPTSGEVYYEIDKKLIADLEWAAGVLGKADEVPGVDRRGTAPLGSAMVQELSRQYMLAPLSKKERNGTRGQWIGGDLRPGRPKADDVPLPDRVELFVRDSDGALLETVHFQDGKPTQRVEVVKLEIDKPMTDADFKIDTDQKPRPVREYLPAWSQIEHVLAEAERTEGAGKRPSERGKDGKAAEQGK
jgi:hypothetical protein